MKKRNSVLIVDDIAQNIQNITTILNDDDLDVLFTRSGKKVMEILEKGAVDLVLIDIMIPDVNIPSICEEINGNELTKNVPIIFIAAYNDLEGLLNRFEFGAFDYISKPFNERELRARVRNYLELKNAKDEVVLLQEKLKKTNKLLLNAYERIEEQNTKNLEIMQLLDVASSTDELTKLANRKSIIESFEEESYRNSRTGRKCGVILADVDDLKKINNEYGHLAGDFVLKEIAKLLQREIREIDKAGRWEGEEFILLLPETDIEGTAKMAERLRNKIEKMEIQFENKKLKTTMTFGVTDFSDETIEESVKRAGNALYRGKCEGKNNVKEG